MQSFAPNTYQAIIWLLVAGDAALARDIWSELEAWEAQPGRIELRPGVPQLLAELTELGVQLGLVANQPATCLQRLAECGIDRHFRGQALSGNTGYRKPDVRLFLHACSELGVMPAECVMVGDRMDNDIVPARLLGMRTVLFRTGRHRLQQARSWSELPDAEVRDAGELRMAVIRLLQRSSGGMPA